MSYSLWTFWRPRRESAEACAAHLKEMFERLSAVHPIFASWRKQGKTKEAAETPFCAMPPRPEELSEIVGKYAKKDDNGKPWPELGYSFSAWTELDDSHGLFFNATVGAFNTNVPEPNSIFFQLGNPRPENQDFLNARVLEEVLVGVAEPWNADWGVVEPWAYDRRLKDHRGHLLRPWGGWLTYLSPTYASEITPPANAHSARLSKGGLLIKVTDDQFNSGDSAHVAVADEVQACLKPLQSGPRPTFRS